MNKKSYFIIGGTLIIIILIIAFSNQAPKTVKYGDTSDTATNATAISPNVTTENGKQIITIEVKAGYSPRVTNAKANIATIIRAKTNSTFDCSSSLRIPSINYAKNLPATGVTDIEIPNQATGSSLRGLCSMGMYSFTVNFSG